MSAWPTQPRVAVEQPGEALELSEKSRSERQHPSSGVERGGFLEIAFVSSMIIPGDSRAAGMAVRTLR